MRIHKDLYTAALLLALGAGTARAEREAPSAPVYAVILDHATDAADAERALNAYKAKAVPEVRVSEGFPRVSAASELPGLPEGQQYVVLGLCDEKAEALAALKQVQHAAPEARVEATTAQEEVACPGPSAPEAPWELQARAWLAPHGKDAKRAWFVYRQRGEPEQCPNSVPWRIVVREDEHVLLKNELATVCRAPQSDTDEGESSQWRVEPMDLGPATVLYVNETHQAAGDTQYTHWLYGYGCGKLVRKKIATDTENAEAGHVEVEKRDAVKGRPAAVRVTHWGDPGKGVRPSAEEFTWAPASCQFHAKRVSTEPEG